MHSGIFLLCAKQSVTDALFDVKIVGPQFKFLLLWDHEEDCAVLYISLLLGGFYVE